MIYSCSYLQGTGSRIQHILRYVQNINAIKVENAPKYRLRAGKVGVENDLNSTSDNLKTWVAKFPWDAPPPGFYSDHDTGSFQNCTSSLPQENYYYETNTSFNDSNELKLKVTSNKIGEGSIVISCQVIHFKAPLEQIEDSGPFIIGILSGAGGPGPERRSAIRNSWASQLYAVNSTKVCRGKLGKKESCRKPAAFFIVAGKWEEIQEEFEKYQDMIWIDQEEVYDGENSVLTQKSFSFFTIAHLLGKTVENGGWRHAIKADDDCYVNIKWINDRLSLPDGEYRDLHYFGNCENRGHRPIRENGHKFSATYQMYPEPEFPTFCLGAGYGVSRLFIQMAIENNHISKIRRMAFEDVAMGMLAERMGNPMFLPTTVNYVRNFRGNSKELNDLEQICIQKGLPVSKCFEDDKWKGWWPPQLDLTDVMVQHRVDVVDMLNIHKSFS